MHRRGEGTAWQTRPAAPEGHRNQVCHPTCPYLAGKVPRLASRSKVWMDGTPRLSRCLVRPRLVSYSFNLGPIPTKRSILAPDGSFPSYPSSRALEPAAGASLQGPVDRRQHGRRLRSEMARQPATVSVGRPVQRGLRTGGLRGAQAGTRRHVPQPARFGRFRVLSTLGRLGMSFLERPLRCQGPASRRLRGHAAAQGLLYAPVHTNGHTATPLRLAGGPQRTLNARPVPDFVPLCRLSLLRRPRRAARSHVAGPFRWPRRLQLGAADRERLAHPPHSGVVNEKRPRERLGR